MTSEAATSSPRSTSERRLLALLFLAYLLNFLDRQILAILKIPIKAELGLTDTQLGLMGGIAFAALYSTLAIPLARLADRRGRVKVIAGSVAVWSAATAVCGAATGFASLFVARMVVGIGEAGGVAPSHALIADRVPPGRRARALAVFSLGIPVGSALGLLLGGWIASALNWRWAFGLVGVAGLPLALALRRVGDGPTAPSPTDGVNSAMRSLAKKPSYWLLALGAASASIPGYGLAFWLPTYFNSVLNLSLAATGVYSAAITLVGGLGGIWLGGVLADRWSFGRPAAQALVPAAAFAAAIPLYVAAMMVRSLALALPLYMLAYCAAQAWLGPVFGAVQRMVAPDIRATVSAWLLLLVNLVGIGVGTFIFGFARDRLSLTYGPDALRFALLGGLAFYLVASGLMLAAAIRIGRDSNAA